MNLVIFIGIERLFHLIVLIRDKYLLHNINVDGNIVGP
jgi:hypothetical protein